MKLLISDSSDRFDNIAFSNVIEDGKSFPTLATIYLSNLQRKNWFYQN